MSLPDLYEKFPDYSPEEIEECVAKTYKITGYRLYKIVEILSKEVEKAKSFKDIPFEILYEVAYRLSDEELAFFCQTSKEIKKLCDDEYFWKMKVLDKVERGEKQLRWDKETEEWVPAPTKDYEKTARTWKSEYKMLSGATIKYLFISSANKHMIEFSGETDSSIMHFNDILGTDEVPSYPHQITPDNPLSDYFDPKLEINQAIDEFIHIQPKTYFSESPGHFYDYERRPILLKLQKEIQTLIAQGVEFDKWGIYDLESFSDEKQLFILYGGAIRFAKSDLNKIYFSTKENAAYIMKHIYNQAVTIIKISI